MTDNPSAQPSFEGEAADRLSAHNIAREKVWKIFVPLIDNPTARDSVPESLWHYTSIGAMSSILESQCFWATDIRYLNDNEELTYAISIFRNVLLAAAEKCSDREEKDFLIWLQRTGDIYANERTYVISFSERPDSLSQWRAYGAPPSVSLALNLQTQATFDQLPIMPIIYDRDEQTKLITSVIEASLLSFRTRDMSDIDSLRWTQSHIATALRVWLRDMLPCIKNPAWSDEAEWRVIVTTQERTGIFKKKYRPSAFGFTPYIELPLRDTAGLWNGRLPITQFQLGPASNSDLSFESLKGYLESTFYSHPSVRVSKSEVPLRHT